MNANVSAPADTKPRKVGFLLGLGIFLLPIFFVWFLLRSGHTTRARIIGFIWFGLTLFAAAGRSPDSPGQGPASVAGDTGVAAMASARPSAKATAVEPAAAPEPAMAITADELYAAYDSNEVAADQRFKGRLVQVSGVVESVDSGISDEPIVSLAAGDYGIGSVYAYGLESNVAATLSKGQGVSLSCTANGELLGTPALRDCSLQ